MSSGAFPQLQLPQLPGVPGFDNITPRSDFASQLRERRQRRTAQPAALTLSQALQEPPEPRDFDGTDITTFENLQRSFIGSFVNIRVAFNELTGDHSEARRVREDFARRNPTTDSLATTIGGTVGSLAPIAGALALAPFTGGGSLAVGGAAALQGATAAGLSLHELNTFEEETGQEIGEVQKTAVAAGNAALVFGVSLIGGRALSGFSAKASERLGMAILGRAAATGQGVAVEGVKALTRKQFAAEFMKAMPALATRLGTVEAIEEVAEQIGSNALDVFGTGRRTLFEGVTNAAISGFIGGGLLAPIGAGANLRGGLRQAGRGIAQADALQRVGGAEQAGNQLLDPSNNPLSFERSRDVGAGDTGVSRPPVDFGDLSLRPNESFIQSTNPGAQGSLFQFLGRTEPSSVASGAPSIDELSQLFGLTASEMTPAESQAIQNIQTALKSGQSIQDAIRSSPLRFANNQVNADTSLRENPTRIRGVTETATPSLFRFLGDDPRFANDPNVPTLGQALSQPSPVEEQGGLLGSTGSPPLAGPETDPQARVSNAIASRRLDRQLDQALDNDNLRDIARTGARRTMAPLTPRTARPAGQQATGGANATQAAGTRPAQRKGQQQAGADFAPTPFSNPNDLFTGDLANDLERFTEIQRVLRKGGVLEDGGQLAPEDMASIAQAAERATETNPELEKAFLEQIGIQTEAREVEVDDLSVQTGLDPDMIRTALVDPDSAEAMELANEIALIEAEQGQTASGSQTATNETQSGSPRTGETQGGGFVTLPSGLGGLQDFLESATKFIAGGVRRMRSPGETLTAAMQSQTTNPLAQQTHGGSGIGGNPDVHVATAAAMNPTTPGPVRQTLTSGLKNGTVGPAQLLADNVRKLVRGYAWFLRKAGAENAAKSLEQIAIRAKAVQGELARARDTVERLGTDNPKDQLLMTRRASVLMTHPQGTPDTTDNGTRFTKVLWREVLEGRIPIEAVPADVRPAIEAAIEYNRVSGEAFRRRKPDFNLTGMAPRVAHGNFYRIIRADGTPIFETMVDAFAFLNPGHRNGDLVGREAVKQTFLDLAERSSGSGSELSQLSEAINPAQIGLEFQRIFREVPSGIYDSNGTHIPLYEDNLILWAQRSSDLISARSAFIEVLGDGRAGVEALREQARADGVNTQMVDEAVQVANGIPLRSLADRMGIVPGTPMGNFLNMVNQTVDVQASLALTAAALPNIAEVFSGGPASRFGFAEALSALGDAFNSDNIQRWDDLGAINRSFYQGLVDPRNPLSSRVSAFRSGLRRVTGLEYLNEYQERLSVAVVERLITKARNGELADRKIADLTKFARDEGFTVDQVNEIIGPTETQSAVNLRNDLLRVSAQRLSGGNKSRVEQSVLQNNPTFNAMFRFTSYPITRMREMIDVMGPMVQDVLSGNATRSLSNGNARRAAQWSIGSAVQGIGGYFILALATGGLDGFELALEEAEDRPVGFALESAAYSTLAGPFGQLMRFAQGKEDSVGEAVVRATFPGSLILEAENALRAKGPYRDQDALERAQTWFLRRSPASRPINMLMATVGLSDKDIKTENAIRGYYRWKSDQPNNVRITSGPTDAETTAFRRNMRRAIEDIKRGRSPAESLRSAIQESGREPTRVAQSLRARRLLSGMDPESLRSLERRIGSSAIRRLAAYDTVLDGWAQAVQ